MKGRWMLAYQASCIHWIFVPFLISMFVAILVHFPFESWHQKHVWHKLGLIRQLILLMGCCVCGNWYKGLNNMERKKQLPLLFTEISIITSIHWLSHDVPIAAFLDIVGMWCAYHTMFCSSMFISSDRKNIKRWMRTGRSADIGNQRLSWNLKQ